jgi:hypothetical protein
VMIAAVDEHQQELFNGTRIALVLSQSEIDV